MRKFDRVRVRGTVETGTVLHTESKRDKWSEKVLYVTVALDDGNIMVYDISELTRNITRDSTLILE
jgi:uncharacterized OB-fold protein